MDPCVPTPVSDAARNGYVAGFQNGQFRGLPCCSVSRPALTKVVGDRAGGDPRDL
jgi:hypothetical protein